MKLFRNLAERWKQWRCKHHWRPVRWCGVPAKHCDYCYQTIPLRLDEFYAVFGRMPIGVEYKGK